MVVQKAADLAFEGSLMTPAEEVVRAVHQNTSKNNTDAGLIALAKNGHAVTCLTFAAIAAPCL